MNEPNRMERMVGELIALRILVSELVDQQGGADKIRDAVLNRLESFEVNSDSSDGAERIHACAENVLKNFPEPMHKVIAKTEPG